MHSGIDTYSMGTSTARSVRLKTYLIFWVNLELRKHSRDVKYVSDNSEVELTLAVIKHLSAYLINGLVMARRVRMNQDGWTMIKDLRFFLNLSK